MMVLYYSTALVLVVCGYVRASEGSTKSEKCSDFDSCSAEDLFRTCSCDGDCYKYGTCCKDSEKFSLMSPKTKKYECYTDRTSTPVYAKKTCAESYTGHDVHSTLCMDNVDDKGDVLGTVLVTSVKSKKTYWNKNCAICNNEALKNLIPWTIHVICPANHGNVNFSKSTIERNLAFDKGAGEWGLMVDDGFLACSVTFSQPPNAAGRLTYCAPNMISSCPPSTSDTDLAEKCLMYHAERKQKSIDQYYRNVHCAFCNGVTEDDLECPGRIYNPVSLNKGRNVVKLSFSNGEWLDTKKVKCSLGNMWDPFAKRCREKPYEAPVLQPVSSSQEIITPFSIFALTAIALLQKYVFH